MALKMENMKTEQKAALGNFIKKRRADTGQSQKELAEKLFVTESAVSKWERGLSYPDISLIPSLCRELEISEQDFFTARGGQELPESGSPTYSANAAIKDSYSGSPASGPHTSRGVAENTVPSPRRNPRRAGRIVSGITLGAYGIALAACFICNLAIEGRLSWFYIVLAALLLAGSLFPLPLLLKRGRIPVVPVSSTAFLFLLEYACNWYAGGSWFPEAVIVTLVPLAVLWGLILLIGYTRLNPWLKGAFAAAAAAFLSAVVNPMAGYLFGYEHLSLQELFSPGSWSSDSIANKIVFYCLLFVAACCILVRVFFSGRGKQDNA